MQRKVIISCAVTGSADLTAAAASAAPVGLLQESTVTGAADRQVVWVAATSPDLLTATAGALSDPGLSGRAVKVDSTGALSPLSARTISVSMRGGAGLATDVVLVAVAGLLLVGVLVLELLRPRRARA